MRSCVPLRASSIVETSTVNLRVKPSSNAPLVERIPIGTVVDVLGDSGSWTKVKAQGKTGYMMTVFLAPVTEEEDDFETGGTLEERITRLEERVAYLEEAITLG